VGGTVGDGLGLGEGVAGDAVGVETASAVVVGLGLGGVTCGCRHAERPRATTARNSAAVTNIAQMDGRRVVIEQA
jgi:hypothetical protein